MERRLENTRRISTASKDLQQKTRSDAYDRFASGSLDVGDLRNPDAILMISIVRR